METQGGPKRDILARFISLFGLDEYGQARLSRVARLTLAQFAIALFAVAMLDLVVWTYQWYLVTESWFMAVALGTIVTVLMLSISRMIVVQSPVRRQQDLRSLFGDAITVRDGRFSRLKVLTQPMLLVAFFALTYALTHYTALTFSVMTFKSEIEKQIALTESRGYQSLVDAAVEKTEREFGRQIAAQEKDGMLAAEQAGDRISVDIEAYKKQRAVERASRVDSHDAAILIQKEAVDRSEQERNIELDKGAGVRVSGAGKFYRTKEANHAKQQEYLHKLQEGKIQELRAFDAETLQHVARKEAGRDAVIADSAKAVQLLRSEMQTKIKQLRSGPVGSVPGEWRISRGFAAQKLALAQIELADKTGATTEKRQESHWLMMLFGFMSAILKIGLGSKVSRYFDPYIQAAQGNKEVEEELKTEGVDDFAAHVRPLENKMVRVLLGDKQQELEMALAAYKMKLAEFAAPITGSGRYRRLHTIQARMSDVWRDHVETVYANSCALSRRAREVGIAVDDMMSGNAFWSVTADQLKELGWKEPSHEQLATLEAAYQEMFRRREEVFTQVRSIQAEAARIASGEYDTILPSYQKLRQSKEHTLLELESARLAAAQVVRSFDEDASEAFDLEAFWKKLTRDLDLIALDKAREKFLAVKREADRQLAIRLQSSESKISGSVHDTSYRRRREYSQDLLPIQVFIEDLEDRYADALPWIGDPRPFSSFWEITEEKMRDLGWDPPTSSKAMQDLIRTTSRG